MRLEIYRQALAGAHRRARHPFWSGIVIVVCIWCALAGLGLWDRAAELRHVHAGLARVAGLLGEHAERTLAEADQIASLVGGAVVERGPALPLAQWKRGGYLAATPFLEVSVLDRAGRLRASTSTGFESTDLSERQYFRVHESRALPSLYVGMPFVGRVSGHWSMPLSRGIVGARDGRFAGVVVVSLDPGYLSQVYAKAGLGDSGTVLLAGTDDFVVRARWSQESCQPGQVLLPGSALREALAGTQDSLITAVSGLDGARRIYAIQRLPGRNLAVLAGISSDAALASYHDRLRAGIAIACVVTVLVMFFQVRQVIAVGQLAALADRETVVRDILAEKKQHLRGLFLAMPDGVAVFGRDRVIDETNTALCELLGVSLSRLRGATQREFVHWLYRGRRAARQACRAEQLLVELDRAEPAGEFAGIVEFDMAVSPAYEVRIVHAASGGGLVLVLRDVTTQLRHDRMKSHFVSAAAHELKAPVAGIAGYAELLSADVVPVERRSGIYHAIHARAGQLNALLSDLLDLARIEARSSGMLERERVEVATLVRETVAGEFAEAGRVRVIDAGVPLHVLADRAQLAQAVRNLIENALKYSDGKDEVTVTVEPLPLEQEKVSVRVEDRGIGMTKEEAGMAFDNFYRANRQGNATGNGLGLAIVREIVAVHQGQITLASEIGKGTVVTLSLPAAT
ncbi:ATP-binding protein [Cupriavidus basilensis]|uniref:ATP-binding protein n=1 Tax=Cupriavidus basilensis TaxID=68895 RepID=UPI0020A66FB5|nr:ATP-binding protein [Cupriavidus basilensis]MCP3019128.1 ATP-binding protein [Cupriavidus basilensis]